MASGIGRRLTALFLLLWPVLLPIAPAPGADSKLPACCRRGGMHHCAMTMGQPESSPGPALQSRCLFFPNGPAVPVSRTFCLPQASQVIFVGLVSHPPSRLQAETLCRISYSRAGQKRGPPAPLS
jgi:hypothetical protein